MGYYIIPLTNEPDQIFTTTIPVNSKNLKLKLRVRLNTAGDYWIMTISDAKTNAVILDDISLLTGINLLGQYKYLGLGSAAIVNVGSSTMDSPNSSSLGKGFLLIWGDG